MIEAIELMLIEHVATRHATAEHCRSQRSRKHMLIRADEAGQILGAFRKLVKHLRKEEERNPSHPLDRLLKGMGPVSDAEDVSDMYIEGGP